MRASSGTRHVVTPCGISGCLLRAGNRRHEEPPSVPLNAHREDGTLIFNGPAFPRLTGAPRIDNTGTYDPLGRLMAASVV